MNLDKMTVPQLRELAKQVPANLPVGGFSKMRKADLVDYITHAEQYERDNAATNVAANDMLAGAIYAAGTEGAADFTPTERQTLNEGKYLGRYHAKRVKVTVGGRRMPGRITDSVHRSSSLPGSEQGDGDGMLLLVVKHDNKARTTLHLPKDVTFV